MAATFIWNLLLANFGISGDRSTTVNPFPEKLRTFKTQGTNTSGLEECEDIIAFSASLARNTSTSTAKFPLRNKTYTKPKAVLEARSPKLRRGVGKGKKENMAPNLTSPSKHVANTPRLKRTIEASPDSPPIEQVPICPFFADPFGASDYKEGDAPLLTFPLVSIYDDEYEEMKHSRRENTCR